VLGTYWLCTQLSEKAQLAVLLVLQFCWRCSLLVSWFCQCSDVWNVSKLFMYAMDDHEMLMQHYSFYAPL
jgi:hypothetical protein